MRGEGRTLKIAFALGCVLLGAGFVATPARVQALNRQAVGHPVPTPVEIGMSTVNGRIRSAPHRARLPARDPLELRVVNSSRRPIMFVAPKFFKAARHIKSQGLAMDLVNGGFLVAPKSTVRVRLRAPAPGRFYYSCFYPGRVPTPESSGYLIVVPAAS